MQATPNGSDAELVAFLVEFTGKEALRNVGDAMTLEECGFDSLSLFQFLLAVEKKFGFAIPERDFTLAHLRTVGDVRKVVSENVGRPTQ